MEPEHESSALTLRWTKRTAYEYRPSRDGLFVLVGIGVVGFVGSVAMSLPMVALTFVCVALIPVAARAPLRTKLVTRCDRVAAYRQRFYANPGVTISVLCGVMSGGMIGAFLLGYSGAGRMLLPALMGVALVPVLLTVSYRERGPLLIDGVALSSVMGCGSPSNRRRSASS